MEEKPPWTKTTPSDAGGAITEEKLRAAMHKLRTAPPLPPHGTSANPHLVSPAAFDRGYGRCVECGQMVSTASLN